MKILLVGDYSNYHACLGAALERLGHNVTIASDGSAWMQTHTDIALRRLLPRKAGGALLYAKMLTDRGLRGFDVVSLIGPAFVTLRPKRMRHVFNLLQRHNGRVFLGAVGNDKAMMDYLVSPDSKLRYSEYFVDGRPYEPNHAEFLKQSLWQTGAIADWCEEIYDRVDGVTTALYEYHLAMLRRFPADKVHYTGIPIDTKAVKPIERELMSSGKVHLFLGRHADRQVFKGTDRIGRAAERVAAELPEKCSLSIVENLPYDEYIQRLRSADLVLDQLYSYTPATNALLAMAAGQAVLSGGEEDYYDFIGEKQLRPIINAVPDDEKLYETIKNCVLHPEIIRQAGAQGRDFVLHHNDSELVAQRHLEFWKK